MGGRDALGGGGGGGLTEAAWRPGRHAPGAESAEQSVNTRGPGVEKRKLRGSGEGKAKKTDGKTRRRRRRRRRTR